MTEARNADKCASPAGSMAWGQHLEVAGPPKADRTLLRLPAPVCTSHGPSRRRYTPEGPRVGGPGGWGTAASPHLPQWGQAGPEHTGSCAHTSLATKGPLCVSTAILSVSNTNIATTGLCGRPGSWTARAAVHSP